MDCPEYIRRLGTRPVPRSPDGIVINTTVYRIKPTQGKPPDMAPRTKSELEEASRQQLLDRISTLKHETEQIYVLEKELDQVYADYPRRGDYINLVISMAALVFALSAVVLLSGNSNLLIPTILGSLAAAIVVAFIIFKYYDSTKQIKDDRADWIKKQMSNTLRKGR
jgi:hypothetical protein